MLTSISKFHFHFTPLNNVNLTIFTRGLRCNNRSFTRQQKLLRKEKDDSITSEDTSSSKKETVDSTYEKSYYEAEPITAGNQYEQLAYSLTPLCYLPYSEQLGIKWGRNREILHELGMKLTNKRHDHWKNNSLPCDLKPILAAPVTEEYRNKDEFRVNFGIDGNPKTVGFMVGRFRDGTARCVNGDQVIITKKEHKLVANHFEKYIRQSPLRACDLFKDGGHWRGITVRSNEKGEMMALVVMHPQNLTNKEIDEQKQLLTTYFQSLDDCKITSMYFQACKHRRCRDTPYDHLFGERYIYEQLLGLKFQISPSSFFQINTTAAELLYKTVAKLCKIDEKSIVVDVCSGTGTIALTLAPHVRAIVGIEVNADSIEDANRSAELNNIKNATFIHGSAESVLPTLIPSLNSPKITVIINPSQSGVGKNVIRALRSCRQLERLIYISCKPDGIAMNNFVSLCKPRSESSLGTPFRPKVAIPLDMFPHTDHCELIVVFEKYEKDEF